MGAMVSELSAEDAEIYRSSISNLTGIFHQDSEFVQLIGKITQPSNLSLLEIQQILFQHVDKTFADQQLIPLRTPRSSISPTADATSWEQRSSLGILATVALQENTCEPTAGGQQASDYGPATAATTKEQTFELAGNPEGTTTRQEQLLGFNFIPAASAAGQQLGLHGGPAITPSHDIMTATGQQAFDFSGDPSATARSQEQGVGFINDPAAFDFMDDPAAFDFVDDPAAFDFVDDPAAFSFMDGPAAFDFMDDPAAFDFMDDPAAFGDPEAFGFSNDLAVMATIQEHALDINNPVDATVGQQASGSQEKDIDIMDGPAAPAVMAVIQQQQISPRDSMRQKCLEFALDFEQQQEETQEFIQRRISEWTENPKCFWGVSRWSGVPTREAICRLFKSINDIDNAEILIPIQRRLHLVIARSFQERLIERITYLANKGTVVPIQCLTYRSISVDIISEIICGGKYGEITREQVARQMRSGERYKSFTSGMLLSLGKVKAKVIERVSNDQFEAIVEYCGEYISNQKDDSSHTTDSSLMDDPYHVNDVDRRLDRLQRALLKDMIIEEGDIDELIESSWPSIIRSLGERRKKRKQKDIDPVNNLKKRLLNPSIMDKHIASSVAPIVSR